MLLDMLNACRTIEWPINSRRPAVHDGPVNAFPLGLVWSAGKTVIELVRNPPGSRALDLHVKGRFHIAGRRAQIDKYKRPLARQATTEGNVPESAKWMDESRAVRADFAYRHDPVQPRRAGEFSHRQQQRGAKSNRKQSCRSLVGLYMAEYEGSNK